MIKRKFDTLLITGGAGFIGTNLIQHLFDQPEFHGQIIIYDKLTYAATGQPQEPPLPDRYLFVKGDLCDRKKLETTLKHHKVDCVIHLAAESHVDRAIDSPAAFFLTNLTGSYTLLEALRSRREAGQDIHLHHVSTDEVFGTLGPTGRFDETSPYRPNNPYSASKAGADHLVRAWHTTYGIPVTLSNCSNNYGPFQHSEKLIPLTIKRILHRQPIPVYGTGKNIRDWLHVSDHSAALWQIITCGETGTNWNIGGENEQRNIDLVRKLCRITAEYTGIPLQTCLDLITFVADRPGHDLRYAVDNSRIKQKLGWTPLIGFDQGLRKTVEWYVKRFG